MNEDFCREVAKSLIVVMETAPPDTAARIRDRFPFIDNLGYVSHVLFVDSDDLNEAIDILRRTRHASTQSNEDHINSLIEEYELDFSPTMKG